MEKSKLFILCAVMTCITFVVTIAFVSFMYFKNDIEKERAIVISKIIISKDSLRNSTNKEDREITLALGLHNQYIYCLKTVMKESRNNNHPCSIKEAERVCARFVKN